MIPTSLRIEFPPCIIGDPGGRSCYLNVGMSVVFPAGIRVGSASVALPWTRGVNFPSGVGAVVVTPPCVAV